MPLTGMVDPKILIDGGPEHDRVRGRYRAASAVFKTFSTNHSPQSASASLRESIVLSAESGCAQRESIIATCFAIIIMQFIDAYAFDVRSVKKTCVHIAHPDGKRLIPFDTYNMFYRDNLESTRLAGLREMVQNV